MQAVSLEKCTNHPDREAAARCPECNRYFCRECITEHEGRVVCSHCLRDMSAKELSSRLDFSRLRAYYQTFRKAMIVTLQIVLGLLLAWSVFHYVGQRIIDIPAPFHEGTVWESPDEDET